MRIIAGTQKGRRLHGPKGPGLRPTADRVKEALFSILGTRVAGSRFLDLYAGTGAIGIEALSRGARHVTFVESNPSALRVLRANITQCKLEAAAEIQTCPTGAFLKRHAKAVVQHDIVFADPPYQQDHLAELWTALAGTATIAPDALIVLEHSSKSAVPKENGRLSLLRQYRYGDTTLSVFEVASQDTLAI
ncbi:MAG: 16S rRNA (guanine(966)-N(2))-methyltransferase RsmD [Nitrospiraceae bacterium]|nr:16S rRNA (guanine(966)-N(2))-methyltransferase RsmD [Nitrospiraceae bacterium]MSR24943.1 16S rRNA (guanine(966)-N(2))-methyltransferase RsmD [Nitrospiraceae bacterium]